MLFFPPIARVVLFFFAWRMDVLTRPYLAGACPPLQTRKSGAASFVALQSRFRDDTDKIQSWASPR
jgi:hypothetical protein